MELKYFIGIMVAITLFCGLVSPAFAGSSQGTAVVSSNPGEAISLVVNGGINNWSLANIGDNINSTGISMVVSSNDDHVVYVRDSLDGGKPANTTGHMSEYDPIGGVYVGGVNLTNALAISSPPNAYVALSGSNQQIESTSGATPSGGTTFPISAKQNIVFADQRLYGHYYRLVITFVAMNA